MPKLILILLVIFLIGGYFIYQKQSTPQTPTNIVIESPEKEYAGPESSVVEISSLENCSADTNLCDLFTNINNSINQENFQNLIEYQKLHEKECLGFPSSICIGAKEGEKRSGYNFGVQDSEYDTSDAQKYIQRLTQYFQKNKPLEYETAVATTNRASIAYSNTKNTSCLFFNIIKEDDTWMIENTIIGSVCRPYLKIYFPNLD